MGEVRFVFEVYPVGVLNARCMCAHLKMTEPLKVKARCPVL